MMKTHPISEKTEQVRSMTLKSLYCLSVRSETSMLTVWVQMSAKTFWFSMVKISKSESLSFSFLFNSVRNHLPKCQEAFIDDLNSR